MVQNAWHGPSLTSWLRTVVFAAKLQTCCAQKQSGGKQTWRKRAGVKRKYIQTTAGQLEINCLPAPLSFLSLLFSDFSFSPSFVQNYNPAVDVLRRWLSAEIGPLELKTPEGVSSLLLVIDKNKSSVRRREARVPSRYNKGRIQTLIHTTITTRLPLHIAAAVGAALPWRWLGSHLTGRASLRCIDHSLLCSCH